jgi:hypothetical protein
MHRQTKLDHLLMAKINAQTNAKLGHLLMAKIDTRTNETGPPANGEEKRLMTYCQRGILELLLAYSDRRHLDLELTILFTVNKRIIVF